jgi:hypothetical protein
MRYTRLAVPAREGHTWKRSVFQPRSGLGHSFLLEPEFLDRGHNIIARLLDNLRKFQRR